MADIQTQNGPTMAEIETQRLTEKGREDSDNMETD